MLRLWIPQRLMISSLLSANRSSSFRWSREAVPSIFAHRLSIRCYRFGRRSTTTASNYESSTSTFQQKSKGQKKREAHRSVDWAIAFESFSDTQLRRAIRWGNLREEVYEAVLTVKKIGRHGKHARTRQLKLIGGMLREVDPTVMEGLIKAINDGDVEGAFKESSNAESECETDQVHSDHSSSNSEDYEDESDVDEEEDENQETSSSEDELDNMGRDNAIVERWLQGLLSGDSDVVAEVYSIGSADFDRQELRRLVRDTLKRERKLSTQSMENAVLEKSQSLTDVSNPRAKLREYLESFRFRKPREKTYV